MIPKEDPSREGHTREWQDRSRVVIDAEKASEIEASPNQSPVNDQEDVEEKSRSIGTDDEREERDPDAVY